MTKKRSGQATGQSWDHALKEPRVNHDWLFNQLIGASAGPSETLQDMLTDPMLRVIDLGRAELAPTRTSAPNQALQDADAVIRVPLLGASGHCARFRILLEAKDRIRQQALMPQVRRYETGLYLQSNEPVVMVLINAGAPWPDGAVMEFRDWLADPGEQFWAAFGEYVSSVKIRVVNLQEAQVRQRLVVSTTACSVGLYAMSLTAEPVAERTLEQIMAKVLRLEDETARQGVLLPTIKYLNSYDRRLTMEDWQAIEIKQTGDSKMVNVAMELAEVFRQEGRQEVMELAEVFRQEGRQEVMEKAEVFRQEGRQEVMEKAEVFRQEGRQEVMEKAEVFRQEGRQEVMEKVEVFRQEGRQEVMEKAEVFRQEGQAATARRMLAAGYELEQIRELCDLSDEQISRLRNP